MSEFTTAHKFNVNNLTGCYKINVTSNTAVRPIEQI